MDTKQKIEVLQAYLDGKPIQIGTGSQWVDYTEGSEPLWKWSSFNYRVKPEPMVLYANIYKNGVLTFNSEEMARSRATDAVIRTAVKFVEVIDEKA